MRTLCFVFILFSSRIFANEISICYEEWRPYAYQFQQGIYKGYVLEKLILSAKRHGIKLIFYELPHARCVHQVKAKTIDFALFVDNTDKLLLLNTEVSSWDISVVTRVGEMPDEKIKLNAKHLQHILIAQDYDYPISIHRYLSSLNKSITKISYYVQKEEELTRVFNLLLKHRADVLIVDEMWAISTINQFDLSLEVSSWSLHQEPQYLGYFELSSSKITLMQQLLNSSYNNGNNE